MSTKKPTVTDLYREMAGLRRRIADLERKVLRLLDERMNGLEARDDAQRRSMGLG